METEIFEILTNINIESSIEQNYINELVEITSSIALSIYGLASSYCDLRSVNGIFLILLL